VTPLYVALISTVPAFTALTRPATLTTAIEASDVCHVASDVTVVVELSLRLANAVNCDDEPALGGVPATAMDVTGGPSGDGVADNAAAA